MNALPAESRWSRTFSHVANLQSLYDRKTIGRRRMSKAK